MILAILALVSRSTWAEIKETQPPSDFMITVEAKQFNWEIAYPVATASSTPRTTSTWTTTSTFR